MQLEQLEHVLQQDLAGDPSLWMFCLLHLLRSTGKLQLDDAVPRATSAFDENMPHAKGGLCKSSLLFQCSNFSYFILNSRASSSLGFVNSRSYASYKAEHVLPVIFSMEKFKSPRGSI